MAELIISRINIIDYRMPLKRPYGTARGVTRGSKNFLVRLFAEFDGEKFEGVGESQPRHRLTGDISHERAWEFLQAVAPTFEGAAVDISSNESALNSVRELMHAAQVLAHNHAEEKNAKKPFRGTLLGIEVALLDLVSRAMKLPLSKLLGEVRDEVAVTVSTLSTQNSQEEFRKKVERQTRYPMVRVKGKGDFEDDSRLLSLVHEANKSVGYVKPIWMDLNEGFDESGASEFIEYIAAQIAAGSLPEIITLEQPVPGSIGDRLPSLQALADRLTDENGVGEIRMMPDESLWDIDDLERIHSGGGCRAMNIKTAKAGGLLASLDLARKAVEMNPDTNICIGGMVGTSDITTWSLISLAKALPRLDYITAVPPGNVKQRISEPLAKFKERDSNIHQTSDQNGIGAALDLEALKPYIHEEIWIPESKSVIGKLDHIGLPQDPTETNSAACFRILFLGDFHYGENYGTGGGSLLPERGYQDGTQLLRPFIDKADVVVANLETPLVSPNSAKRLQDQTKRFAHWSDDTKAAAALKELGIDAVSLANNHTLDCGVEGLQSTLDALKHVDVATFGAGDNLNEAQKPLRLKLPDANGGGNVVIHSVMQVPTRTSYEEESTFATEFTAGCAPLDNRSGHVPPASDEHEINIAFPHWGQNYKWRSGRQRRLAADLVNAGHDLIIGHGAHCIQEFEEVSNRWVVFGIGNGHFQAKGRFEAFETKNGIIPFGLWSMLKVETVAGQQRITLQLYPVYSDNTITDFRPGPVKSEDFSFIVDRLHAQAKDKRIFNNGDMSHGLDELGHYIKLEVGARSILDENKSDRGESEPTLGVYNGSHEDASIDSRALDANAVVREEPQNYIDENSQKVLKSIQEKSRILGTYLISETARKRGAEVSWFNTALASISYKGRKVLISGNRGVESVVGSGLIKDKYLTKMVLAKYGVGTPEGYIANSEDAAVTVLDRFNGRRVVVKPRFGDRGKGITVGISSKEDVRQAYRDAIAARKGDVLIEECIEGTEFRCIGTDKECLSVLWRIPPNVVGDGASSIRELIEEKNKYRSTNPHLYNRLIPSDTIAERFLARTGRKLESVPSSGEVVYVRDVGNFSRGADSVECFDRVDDSVKQTCADAVAAIPGMKWAGLDLLVADDGSSYVLEVNANSGIGGHHYPVYGEPKDVATHIWEEKISYAPNDAENLVKYAEPVTQVTSLIEAGDGPRERTLERLVLDSLDNRGWRIITYPAGLAEVISPDGISSWLRNGRSDKDLSSVSALLSRPRQLRRALISGGLQCARMERLPTGHGDWADKSGIAEGKVLLPARGEWSVSSAKPFISGTVSDEANSSGVGFLVQEAAEGNRLRLVASRNTVLLVTGTTSEACSRRVMNIVCNAAIKAIRTVPELRWGCVEILIPSSTPASPVIEGLSQRPHYSDQDYILGGSIDAIVDFLMQPS